MQTLIYLAMLFIYTKCGYAFAPVRAQRQSAPAPAVAPARGGAVGGGQPSSGISAGSQPQAAQPQQGGISGGQGGPAQSPGAELAALETHKALNSALAKSTASAVSPGTAKDFLNQNPECVNQAVEGNMKVINDKIKQDCIESVNQRKAKAEKLVKLLTKPGKEKTCVKRLNPNSLVCQAKNVMENIIKAPKFKINLYGDNVVMVKKEGQPILLGIAENIHYDVTKIQRRQASPLKRPTAQLEFNELGSLLRQEGEIPKPKKLDPCGSCLEHLSKKAQTEGEKDECGGCDSFMELTNVKNTSFKNTNPQDDKVGSNKPSTKPANDADKTADEDESKKGDGSGNTGGDKASTEGGE